VQPGGFQITPAYATGRWCWRELKTNPSLSVLASQSSSQAMVRRPSLALAHVCGVQHAARDARRTGDDRHGRCSGSHVPGLSHRGNDVVVYSRPAAGFTVDERVSCRA
jgi:hypothetical protein